MWDSVSELDDVRSMKGKWSDFLVTLAVRFLLGAIAGLLLSIPVTFFAGARGPGRRRSLLVEWVQAEQYQWLALWFCAWGLGGGLLAAFTIPKWQTPWYKRQRWTVQDSDDDVQRD